MLCSLVMENGDIVHKAASFCDLSDLIRLRLLNRTWRDVVMSIFLQLYGGHDSEIRLYTFKPRLDYPNIIWHCLAAWTSYRRPIGRFLLTGGCFAGALPHECCLIETRSSNQAEIELVETVDSMQITHDGLNHEENVSNTATIQPRAEYLQLRRTPFPNEALSSRIGASSCAVAVTGNRLLFGGWDTHSANVVQKIYSLDPRNLELGWRDTGSITPTPLCFSSSTTLRDGRILFSGGKALNRLFSWPWQLYLLFVGGSSPYRGAAVSPGCFISDPGEESDIQWRPYLSMNTRRCGHVTMTALDGSVVALGGYSGDLSYLRTGEILAEQSHAWTSLPDMEFQRSGAGETMQMYLS